MQEGGEDVLSSGEEMGKQWASIYSQKWTGASTDHGPLKRVPSFIQFGAVGA